ncbi:MAG: hypothetical protein JST73_09320, partial [Actinobacteria bacterium]|nr:hypothetical protein [Actinomycetota bacterium]
MSPSIAAADTVEATEVRLSNEEASIVAAEAAAAAEVLSEPERSAALALARYAETGSVPAASIGT